MAKDRMKLNGFVEPKLPALKGHIKLTLKNAETGEVEKTVEGDNVITDAVKDILKYNLLGSTDASKILNDVHSGINDGIWRKWFGGILCYENAHSNTNASDYFMENNPVTAHAGMTAIDADHDDDTTRGQAVQSSFIRTADSMKIVWEWGAMHGNGIIRALSLCHSDTGSYGNGIDSYHFKNSYSPWEQIQGAGLGDIAQNPRAAGNAFAQYDENHTVFFYIGADEWYEDEADVPAETDMESDVTVYIRRLPYNKAGLFDLTIGSDADDDTRKFTITTSIGFKYNPAYYFDPSTKYLWLFTNFLYASEDAYGPYPSPYTSGRVWSRNTVYYSVIDCENEIEVDSGTIISNADDLAFLECSADKDLGDKMHYNSNVIHENIIIADGYVYLPLGESQTIVGQGYSTTQNFIGFKKINLSDQTDQTTIVFSDEELELGKYFAAVQQGDLISGFGYVINDDKIYPCKADPMTGSWNNIYVNELNNLPVVYAPTRPNNEGTTATARYILASKLVNTSKINLDTAVQKTSNQVMTIEYTITENTGS